MKNVVRALTLVLAVTGMAAAAQVSTTSGKSIAGKVDYVPVPCCAPDDPDACGWAKKK